MEYQNSFDTTLHTIRRPASTVSAKIPRALPVGSYEQWTLTLTDSSGTSISDILGLIAVYGGVVAIEEDVIFAKVEDFCYLNYDGAYDRYYFPGNHHLVGDHPIVAEIDFTCEIVHARYLYLLDHTDYDPENQSDLDAFSEYIITTLFQKRADGDPAVSDESSLGEPDWYEEENGGPRLAQTVQKTALDAKVFPNPFQDRFILETKDLSGLAQLIVHNIQGQVIHREQLDLQGGTEEALIKTQGWAPGLYQLSLVHDSGIFSQKLIKQ